MNGAIVAGVISIILIYYGGQPGTIGGVIGILGAIVAAAKPYLPWSQQTEAGAAATEFHAPPAEPVPCWTLSYCACSFTEPPRSEPDLGQDHGEAAGAD